MAKLTTRKKIFLSVALAVVFLFLAYNVVWFINYKSYDKFIDDAYVKSPHSMSSYSKKAGESTYTVKKPDYLQLTGNLAIDNADSSVGIIIWPSFMQKSIKDYGLTIYDTEADMGYMIYVDKNMRYDTLNRTGLSQDSEAAAIELLNQLRGKVDEQYQLMRSEFGLKG